VSNHGNCIMLTSWHVGATSFLQGQPCMD
jgi:hypothetical protein